MTTGRHGEPGGSSRAERSPAASARPTSPHAKAAVSTATLEAREAKPSGSGPSSWSPTAATPASASRICAS
ncbi:hypothetical protein [Conexibacter sp. SYSU D00693]|uniref:hypothetical protein n=1 Tax=Conexibacter sp. SYSU D00693 TaxID=2812560 RepID=UPI00196B28B1